MKEAIREILREFYQDGVPEGVVPRDVDCQNGGGTEVDFHVFDKVTRTSRLVQVSWDMTDKARFAREFDALVAARKATGVTDCTVVTWDDEGEKDGIRIVPAWKWLLA